MERWKKVGSELKLQYVAQWLLSFLVLAFYYSMVFLKLVLILYFQNIELIGGVNLYEVN